MSDLVSQFAELFQGRTDVYGAEHGESVPVDSSVWSGAFADPTGLWLRHLEGETPIGVYPLTGPNPPHSDDEGFKEAWGHSQFSVRWGCVDFDEGYDESWADAVNLRNSLAAFGITAWIERSRSKGYHVWVFCSEWVDALVMRKALIAACQVVGAPIKEVNPKQTVLKEGQVGNYVRLPYPGVFAEYMKATRRQVMVEPSNETWPFELFVLRALAARCTQADLEPLAELAVEPKRDVKTDAPMAAPESQLPKELTDKLSGLAWTLFQQGPLDGDRSDGEYRLCRLMWESGTVTKDDAWQILCDADRRWGKHLNKDEDKGAEYLWNCLERAWSQ